MPRSLSLVVFVVCASALAVAQGRVKSYGKAIVEYRSPDALAVVNYEYSQRTHDGPWLLVEFALGTRHRVVIKREEFSLILPDERRLSLASHQQYIDESAFVTRLYQNAAVFRRPLSAYFTSPLSLTIRFFPGKVGSLVQDTFATNVDEVAAGDLMFRSPDGKWAPGDYRLVLNHETVKVELPLELK
jgi:hypothetical protein